MKKKNLDTLVEDIYKALEPLAHNKPLPVTEQDLENFGKDMKETLAHWALPEERGTSTLRMSNIGKPERQLWFDAKSEAPQEIINPSVYIKFLYGHLLETVLLFLVKLSGHKVEDEQKEVNVEGIKGHMDCKIDGQVVDIKTASSYAFKKFSEGTLSEEDSFGYITQLTGYEEAEQTNEGGFLALNKETGEIALFRPNEFDKPNVKLRIQNLKKILKKRTPPELCYQPEAEGSSGNFKLPRLCTYCRHKFECHKDANNGRGLRVFKYARGPVFFTHVESEPKVEEIVYESKKSKSNKKKS
jgi:hypothetical protein